MRIESLKLTLSRDISWDSCGSLSDVASSSGEDYISGNEEVSELQYAVMYDQDWSDHDKMAFGDDTNPV